MTDDDRTVDALRRLDDAEYPGRDRRLDPAPVVRAGRRRRSRRAAAGAGAGALVLALAVALPTALGDGARRPAGPGTPAASSQAPRTFGDGPVASLTHDLQAVNQPERVAPDELRVADVGGLDLTIRGGGPGVVVTIDGTGTSVTMSDGTVTTLPDNVSALTWRAGDEASDYPQTEPYSATDEWFDVLGGDAFLLYRLGAVPSWLRDPTVLLYSSGGIALPNGSSAPAVELPTFRAPTADGRLLYLVVLRDEAARRMQESRTQLAFVGADGDAYLPGCGDVRHDGCTFPDGVSLRTVLDGTIGRPTATTAPSTAAPTPDPDAAALLDGVPDTPAPAPLAVGPGIAAATGLSSAAGVLPDGLGPGTAYRAGGLAGAAVLLGTGPEPVPWFTVLGVRDGEVSDNATGPRRALFEPADRSAITAFRDVRDGYLQAGVTPPGAPRAFFVSIAPFELADGARHRAFELPTFAPPPEATGRLADDQRMFAVAFGRPATDLLFDTTSGLVYARPDGALVAPGCPDGDPDACAPFFAEAYDEVRALVVAG